ncbi:MAG: gamma carbonic anhydrase family protein, partial [Solobacterium sp.]|nr:gamma carbonic anhydrase family protein [Solobacterium sp.]
SVIRGDTNSITIGNRVNIQDLCMLHTDGTAPLVIGDNVTVGHYAILHGCTIGSHVVIGMGSIILNHACIPDYSIVGAGSLVTENKTFPEGYLIFGRPAKAVRPLTEEEIQSLDNSAMHYIEIAKEYLSA